MGLVGYSSDEVDFDTSAAGSPVSRRNSRSDRGRADQDRRLDDQRSGSGDDDVDLDRNPGMRAAAGDTDPARDQMQDDGDGDADLSVESDGPDPFLDDPSNPLVNPARLSGHSFFRSQVRLDTVPLFGIFDIPASPPDSPAETTESRFRTFVAAKTGSLDGREAKHFNARLVATGQLLNPALELDPLGRAGMAAHETYDSALSARLAVPAAKSWPEWAFVDRLRAAQDRMREISRRQQTRDKGKATVQFVPAERPV